VVLALAMGAFGAVGAGAQVASVDGSGPALVTRRADSLYLAGHHEESLALLETYLASSPDDVLVEVMAAREALVLGTVDSYTDAEKAKPWYRRSIEHGERAMAMAPLDENARYVTLAAEGRLALIEGARERARLGVVVDTAARALLAQDSLYAGAHNALGHLYFEVARLSWIERIFARHWMGGDLVSRATWKAAEAHLRRAIELQPERNLYYVDLGALYVKRGRLEEARSVLEEALKVPLEIPAQQLFRDDARRLLDEVAQRTGDAG
jgi:tetratricopeptide (TPR) repeat protein